MSDQATTLIFALTVFFAVAGGVVAGWLVIKLLRATASGLGFVLRWAFAIPKRA